VKERTFEVGATLAPFDVGVEMMNNTELEAMRISVGSLASRETKNKMAVMRFFYLPV
jgi:hypothetical protein